MPIIIAVAACAVALVAGGALLLVMNAGGEGESPAAPLTAPLPQGGGTIPLSAGQPRPGGEQAEPPLQPGDIADAQVGEPDAQPPDTQEETSPEGAAEQQPEPGDEQLAGGKKKLAKKGKSKKKSGSGSDKQSKSKEDSKDKNVVKGRFGTTFVGEYEE
jgi:hypothetical protein